MTSEMMHGDHDVVGSLTSGGTESILMAMKVYRDRARKLWPRIKHPQMVSYPNSWMGGTICFTS